jgi:hypothetical protein
VRAFVDETYTDDGDGVPSPFMREVALSGYEPACIEAIHEDAPVPLAVLLAGASYSDQWLPPWGRTAAASPTRRFASSRRTAWRVRKALRWST